MSVMGRVDSLWRFPVKGMRGETLDTAFVGFAGVYGDRVFAVRSAANPKGFPFFTGRAQPEMIRYRARFRHPERVIEPPDLSAARSTGPGITPLYAEPASMIVDVETPDGQVLAIDDSALLGRLRHGVAETHVLSLLRSERALTDCRPVSLFSLETARALGGELRTTIDPRRFRANVNMDLGDTAAFAEDAWVGRSLRIGVEVVVSIIARDPRCKIITLDPDTGESSPELLRVVVQNHETNAGVYGAVLAEGTVRPGDPIELLD
ncbi:MAG: MOSC domain-containing protein [Candidatus Eisenbacteria bacterium]